MKAQALRNAIDAMAGMPDTLGCALVDLAGGMVWHAAGSMPGVDDLASASSDYWRLNGRGQQHFKALGDLRVAVLMHAHAQITISECGKGMLLVLVTQQMAGVDWVRWKQDHTRLAAMVTQM